MLCFRPALLISNFFSLPIIALVSFKHSGLLLLQKDIRCGLNLYLFNVSLYVAQFFQSIRVLFLHFEFVAAQRFLHHILSDIESNYSTLFRSCFDSGINYLLLFSFLPALFFILLLCFDASIQSFPHIFIPLPSDCCLLRSELFV